MLKPSYNSVDMADVELMDDGYGPRDYSSFLLEVGANIVFVISYIVEMNLECFALEV